MAVGCELTAPRRALRRSLTSTRQRIEAGAARWSAGELAGAIRDGRSWSAQSCSRRSPLTDSAAYLRANPSLSQEDLSFERLRTRTDFGSRGADAP